MKNGGAFFIMQKIKDNRAITLIALVVTIVILIILATISIYAVLRRKWINCQSRESKRIT